MTGGCDEEGIRSVTRDCVEFELGRVLRIVLLGDYSSRLQMLILNYQLSSRSPTLRRSSIGTYTRFSHDIEHDKSRP